MNKIKYCFATVALLAGLAQVGCNTRGDKLAASLGPLEMHDLLTAANTETKDSVEDVHLAAHTEATPIRVLNDNQDLSELVANAPGIVLVDFYADWCGPCKKQSEVLHDVEEFASSVNAQIIKVNVDDHRKLASKYRVSSLPTLIVLRNGEVEQTKTGFTSSGQVRKMLR